MPRGTMKGTRPSVALVALVLLAGCSVEDPADGSSSPASGSPGPADIEASAVSPPSFSVPIDQDTPFTPYLPVLAAAEREGIATRTRRTTGGIDARSSSRPA